MRWILRYPVEKAAFFPRKKALVQVPYPPLDRIAPPRTRSQTPAKRGFFMRGQIGLRPRARRNGRVLQRILQPFCEVVLGHLQVVLRCGSDEETKTVYRFKR